MANHRSTRTPAPLPPRKGLSCRLLLAPAPTHDDPDLDGSSPSPGRAPWPDGTPYPMWVEHTRGTVFFPRGSHDEARDRDRRGLFFFATEEAGLVTLPGVRRVIPVLHRGPPTDTLRHDPS